MKRILSIDILRGITVAGMILVNNPGAGGEQYAPLRHAAWNGMTPTDLVFPFFLFIMGISAYFSLSKRLNDGFYPTFKHVFKRSAMIFLVGILLQVFSLLCAGALGDLSTFRIMGVLQALALSYLLGAALMMGLKFRHMLLTSAIILVGYAVMLICGNGYEISTDNIIAKVDKFLLGEGHLYTLYNPNGVCVPLDPEGILSLIPKVAQFILGAFVGKLIIDGKGKEYMTLSNIMLFGALCVMCGFLLQYGLPFNKIIWSPSFVLATSGLASLLLGVLMWIIDIKEKRQWTGFFNVFGTNPLFLYCVAWILSIIMGSSFIFMSYGVVSLKQLLFVTCLEPYFGTPFGSLIYSLLFVGIVWLIGYPLYKKRIFIKL